MLVLSRKPGEEIRVDDITIIVQSTAKGRVKLGIVAPDDVRILRGELVEFDSEPMDRRPRQLTGC
ncbi:MAG: carbon storage regulator [Planctomycetales bacterium]|nr:carbon storage regulator [Planctomycetales bacterium]